MMDWQDTPTGKLIPGQCKKCAYAAPNVLGLVPDAWRCFAAKKVKDDAASILLTDCLKTLATMGKCPAKKLTLDWEEIGK